MRIFERTPENAVFLAELPLLISRHEDGRELRIAEI